MRTTIPPVIAIAIPLGIGSCIHHLPRDPSRHFEESNYEAFRHAQQRPL
jgi:hypothetical protein